MWGHPSGGEQASREKHDNGTCQRVEEAGGWRVEERKHAQVHNDAEGQRVDGESWSQ